MKEALILFVRKPELGRVKTRLASSIGEKGALLIYNKLLNHTKEISSISRAHKFIFYTEQIERNDLWEGADFSKRVQNNEDLGCKMKAAFKEVFNLGYQKVVIIGSDCLELTTEIINDAFQKLEATELVIGPAKDGGYYLLGMKEIENRLFNNIAWSTGTVYAETLEKIRILEKTYSVLPLLSDIDTVDDLSESLLKEISITL
ncbi:MAG: TIGR04282 family arsenosugar biosynthesis glycosyltransferase [Chitinophagaceae bacterium]